jgi:hypothetical protein
MLQLIQHVDGRLWIRKGGKLIHETKTALGAPAPIAASSLIDFAKANYKLLTEATPTGSGKKRAARKETEEAISGRITEALQLLAAAPVITVTHPQFVRPYSW